MSREMLADPLAERRLRELERIARARVALLIETKRKGAVIIRIELEGGELSWHSSVSFEERPLTRESV